MHTGKYAYRRYINTNSILTLEKCNIWHRREDIYVDDQMYGREYDKWSMKELSTLL